MKDESCGKLHKARRVVIPAIFIAAILLIWQAAGDCEMVPAYLLPTPIKVVTTLIEELPGLSVHIAATLAEAFIGLAISILLAAIFTLLMDRFDFLYQGLYPLLIVTQTVPAVAIAPLIVLWFGYDMLPKVILIVIVCFFPITVNWLLGIKSVDKDTLRMMKSMHASYIQVLRFIKLPASGPGFFSGLKIAASYAIVGGVIAEWLGGFNGLGVYMTQVRKSYAYDKMFAVIVLVSLISLVLIGVVDLIERKVLKWKKYEGENRND